jgi:hypothetical protein
VLAGDNTALAGSPIGTCPVSGLLGSGDAVSRGPEMTSEPCRVARFGKVSTHAKLLLLSTLALFDVACEPSGTPGTSSTADATLTDLQGCKSPADCNDGDPCTQDNCGPGGLCSAVAVAGCSQPCDPLMQCTVGVCDPGKNACVGCVQDGDCKAGMWCDSGKCAVAKACKSDLECKTQSKVCSAGPEVCVDCESNADCAAGTRCEGRHCVPRKVCASSKDCPKLCDKKSGFCIDCNVSGDCSADQYCNPFGQCAPAICTVGTCLSTRHFPCKSDRSGFEPGTDCASLNPCSTGTCQSSGCATVATSGLCNDGNLCTSADACKEGKCAGAAIDCTDKNPCTLDTCSPTSGCKHTTHEGTCDDGNSCSTGDSCENGTCAGVLLACDDGDPCTTDACSQSAGCGHLPSGQMPCSDGNSCTSDDVCIAGGCKGGPVSCDDGQPCTADACNTKSGCSHVPVNSPCDDGDLCTDGDACKAGKCAATAKNCDDGVGCTVDTCSQGVGCLHKPVDGACDDNNTCTDDACSTVIGCDHKAVVATCSDGNACTSPDVCMDGNCAGGQALKCDDGNPCTDDTCQGVVGCVALPNAATCDDGAACTGTDLCAKGKCAGQPRLFQVSAPGSTYGHFLAETDDGFAAAAAAGPNQVKLARYGKFGQQIWEKSYATSGGFGSAGSVRLVGSNWGFGIGYGTIAGGLIATDLEGNKKWQVDIGAGMGGIGSGGLVSLPDGLIWAGRGQSSGTHLVRVNNTGGIVWDVTDPWGDIAVNQATLWQQGILLIGTNGSFTGFAKSFSFAGAAMWTATYPGQPNGVVAVADGFVLAGSQRNEGIDYVWLAKIDVAGKIMWSRTMPQQYAGATALALVTGGWVAAGWINGVSAGNGDDFLLMRMDLDGNPLWTRSYGDAKQNRAGAVLAFGDGFLLGGPELIRTDAFGNATCGSSGTCVTLQQANCQDANACTADECTAAKGGCYFPGLSDGLKCGLGKTCKAAVCAP